MADDGSQQRKPDFPTAVEDIKALSTVLVMKLESVLGRRLKLRSPAVLATIGVVATIVLAVVVVMTLLRTGDAKAVSENAPLIAAVIALGGVGTAQMVSIALEDQRTRETRALEDQRTQEARNLEAQRAREAALQNYFENVGELLIEKPLRQASPGDNLSTVVRAQTLSVLEDLDPDRKRILLLFLYESGLIYERKLVVSLVAAKLNGANLSRANLNLANLNGANLNGANLSRAYLFKANLRLANLIGAGLHDTYLSGTDLSRAYLNLANLRRANLSRANLRDARLIEADLRDANLSDAEGLTDEQIAAAKSLEGATMPNGQKYEEWLKDREKRQQDE